ncbi:MAG: hypothetical protein CL389_09930 [Acidiferrobacteraceae bacterium]|nr:hypothetical protein [Acidiferrobacteraceae bacterium]|tara:strand:- start:33656 stop:33850 length:195 start_codon:yes stop_codon:yes gene_type:complete
MDSQFVITISDFFRYEKQFHIVDSFARQISPFFNINHRLAGLTFLWIFIFRATGARLNEINFHG